MKQFIKNNLIGFILGVIIAGSIGVYAGNIISADKVNYKDSNVEEALDTMYTQLYEKCPAILPTKSGFLNHTDRTLGTPSNTANANTNKRTWNISTFAKGLSMDNYYNSGRVESYEITDNKISVNSNCGYGLAFPMELNANSTYKIEFSNIYNLDIYVLYYSADGTYISKELLPTTTLEATFTVLDNAYYTVVDFVSITNQCNYKVNGYIENPTINLVED